MAGANRSLERRELKMGRSKFPGKPVKYINKRRVNLKNCDLPNHNEGSIAAENICNGMRVFNKTFGDREFVSGSPPFLSIFLYKKASIIVKLGN